MLTLSACDSKELSCYEIYNIIPLRKTEVEAYLYRSDLNDVSFFSNLYYGKNLNQMPDEFAYCDDYYVALCSSLELWEVHIFRVVSMYNSGDVVSMLQNRRDRLQRESSFGMYSDAIVERIENIKIFTIDKYVIMLVTDHNAQTEDTIRKLI